MPKGGVIIDILELIDRLEALNDHGWRMPLGNKVAIDADMFLNILDQMRISIPQEIKQAKEIQRDRDKYVAQAQEEARRIIAQAREDAAKQLDDHKLRQAAEAQSQALLKRAEQEAAQIRAGAEEYAEGRLKELSEELTKLQQVIHNGVDTLEQRRIRYHREQAQVRRAADAAGKPPEPEEVPETPPEEAQA